MKPDADGRLWDRFTNLCGAAVEWSGLCVICALSMLSTLACVCKVADCQVKSVHVYTYHGLFYVINPKCCFVPVLNRTFQVALFTIQGRM